MSYPSTDEQLEEVDRDLEDRVVARLAMAGVVRKSRNWRAIASFAAVVMITAVAAGGGGWVLGVHASRSASAQSDYAIIIYGDSVGANASEATAIARMREYNSWERSTYLQSASVTASERLGKQIAVLGQATPEKPLRGFYLVKAANAAQAVELARTNPHLRYGGAVIVRAISHDPPEALVR